MSTTTKSKKPARKPSARRSGSKVKLPSFMEISPISGLAVAKARRSLSPVKNLPAGAIKLADWEIALMNKTPSYGPDV
ncbi:MAG: hypothetical protein WC205_13345 [Opitutaceae bacterium]|jgi:hypothetical protein